jgi:hypothetical protein
VLELYPTSAALIGCYARPAALDSLGPGGLAIRVAPNELLLVAAAAERGAALEDARRALAAADPGGLVFDLSAGFAIWTLAGDGRHEAYARLCAIRPPEPPACVQGLFAHVPAKIVVETERVHVLVASTVGHHVRERVLGACADLEPREGPEAPLAPAVGAPR